MAVSAGASRGRLLGQITLPAVLPELFTSLRIGVGTALAVLFIVEAYGTRAGIGYYILDAWSRIDYLEMYGGIVVISVVGAALFLAVDLLARPPLPLEGAVLTALHRKLHQPFTPVDRHSRAKPGGFWYHEHNYQRRGADGL